MIVKVQTWIYLDVADDDEAEAACTTLHFLADQIRHGFPHGEIIDADVDHFEAVSEAEVERRGLGAL